MTAYQPQKIPIYEHTLPCAAPLLSALHEYLPYSIPLLRRLQYPGGFKSGALLLASFPPLSPPSEVAFAGDAESDRDVRAPGGIFALPFIIGVFDPNERPGIQGWIFSSVELPPSYHITDPWEEQISSSETTDLEAMAQVLSLFARFAELSLTTTTLSVSPSTVDARSELHDDEDNSDGDDDDEDDDYEDYIARARRAALAKQIAYGLLGTNAQHHKYQIIRVSMHEQISYRLFVHTSRPFLFGPQGEGAFRKYLIPVGPLRKQLGRPDQRQEQVPPGMRLRKQAARGEDGQEDEAGRLPTGMYFSPIVESDWGLVQRNRRLGGDTKFPAGWPNCGIRLSADHGDAGPMKYPTGTLIAHAFLASDGSLRYLYVDHEFQGRGLGTKLSKHLLLSANHIFNGDNTAPSTREQRLAVGDGEFGSYDWTTGDMCHADVWHGNRASDRVMAKLGAVPGWQARWQVVELDKITALYGSQA